MTASLFDTVTPPSTAGSAPLFDDGKEPDALRTIGEVARALGIRQHVLRYWEEQFPGLRPIKRSGSRRYYRPEDVALIASIHRLVHREGYTLRGAAKALGTKAAPAAEVPAKAVPEQASPGNLVADLRAIRARLAQALEDA